MAEKRYYWLKLKSNFFDQKAIKRLRKIAGGDTYTIIYLKMQLKSLDADGKLYYEGFEEDFISELALDLDEEIDNVKITLIYLEKHNLIKKSWIDETEQYSIEAVKNNTGAETAGAARSRKHRAKIKALHCNGEALQYNNSVTDTKHLRNGELELEKEIEKDKEIHKEKCILTDQEFKEIWALRPKRDGTNSPFAAKRAIVKLIKSGRTAKELGFRLTAYNAYCNRAKLIKTRGVMMVSTFFGQRDNHFLDNWENNGYGQSSNKSKSIAELSAEFRAKHFVQPST